MVERLPPKRKGLKSCSESNKRRGRGGGQRRKRMDDKRWKIKTRTWRYHKPKEPQQLPDSKDRVMERKDSWPAYDEKERTKRGIKRRRKREYLHPEYYRIPNLELHLFSINIDHTSPKLNSNCEIMNWLEPFVCELEKKTGLSDTFLEHKINQKRKLPPLPSPSKRRVSLKVKKNGQKTNQCLQ